MIDQGWWVPTRETVCGTGGETAEHLACPNSTQACPRTLAQQEASRNNGNKSRGPVTAEGKARVSQNGTTHGIYSKRVVVKGEDQGAFDLLHGSLIAQWQPVNDYEANLITDIAEARWRLARFLSLSTEALDLQVELMRPDLAEEWPAVPTPARYVLAFNEAISRNRTLEVLESAINKQHRIIQGATRQLMQLRKMRPELDGRPTTSADKGSEATVTLTRAELAQMIEAAVTARLVASAPPAAAGPEKPQSPPRKSKPGSASTPAPDSPGHPTDSSESRSEPRRAEQPTQTRPAKSGPDRFPDAA